MLTVVGGNGFDVEEDMVRDVDLFAFGCEGVRCKQ